MDIIIAIFWWYVSLDMVFDRKLLSKLSWESVILAAFCLFNATAYTYVGFLGPNIKLSLLLAVVWGIFSLVCGVILITDRKYRREPSYRAIVGLLIFDILNVLYCLFSAGYLF